MKILGVDLGSYSIKIAELDVSSKGYVVHQIHDFPLTSDPNRDRSLEIIEILRNFSARFDATSTRWVVGVPQHHVSVHHKRFPFRERLKILKSLPFELEDEIPLEIEDTIYDAKVVEYIGQSSDVLAVACPKESIQEILDLCKDGGFDPEIVSTEGLALANVVENWNAAPPEVSPTFRQIDELTAVGVTAAQPARLVLHLGYTRSLLLVYRDGGLISLRSILWGGADIANALSQAFAIPMLEAVKILNTKSFILMNSAGATQDQLHLSNTISGCIDSLIRELRLTLLEVKAAFNVEFREVDLMGGMSQIQNLGAYITQALEIPANVSHYLQQGKQTRFEVTPHIEASASIAIGLAIEAMKRPRNPPINLRKEEFARENLALTRFWETWRLPATVAITAFFIFFAYSIVRESVAEGLLETIDERVTEVAKDQAGLRGAKATESGIRAYINRQSRQLKLRDELTQMTKYVSAMDILTQLSEKLPVVQPPKAGQGLDVSYLSIQNDEVVLEGYVQGANMVPAVESALKEIGVANSLQKVTPSNLSQRQGTAFGYKIKVKRLQ